MIKDYGQRAGSHFDKKVGRVILTLVTKIAFHSGNSLVLIREVFS